MKKEKEYKYEFDKSLLQKDKFNISRGNEMVLKFIPSMMMSKKYRKKLRILALEFLQEIRLKRDEL